MSRLTRWTQRLVKSADAPTSTVGAPVTALRPSTSAVRPSPTATADLLKTRALWRNARRNFPELTPEGWIADLIRLNRDADAQIATLNAELDTLRRTTRHD